MSKCDKLAQDSIEAKSMGLSYGQLQQLRYKKDPSSYRRSCRQEAPKNESKDDTDYVAS